MVKLPRTSGRKDSEYMHLFCGPIEVEAHAVQATEARATASPARSNVAELEERVSALEAEVARLKEALGE